MSGMPASDPPDDLGVSSPTPIVRQILVPDAGVGVKWLVPKTDSDSAVRLLDCGYELHTPSYSFTEAASVLQRKVAVDRTLSEAEGLEAFQLLFERSR
jgi:predicted nucleic acid-binding protein